MRIKLTDDTDAILHISHKDVVKSCWSKDKHLITQPRRATQVSLIVLNVTLTEEVICHPADNFCRALGRKLAAVKLLKRLTELGWSRDARKKVFLSICPQYKGSTV